MRINIYRGSWTHKQEVGDELKWSQKFLDSIEIIYANYEVESYSGDAWIVIRKDGKLLEAHAGHCSCDGLEISEEDFEETNLESIMKWQNNRKDDFVKMCLEDNEKPQ